MHTKVSREAFIGLVIAGSVALGAPSAQAEHLLEAEHVAPVFVDSEMTLELQVEAATGCVIALVCGWVVATLHYEGPDGRPVTAFGEGPYQPFQVITITVPADHLAGTSFSYWLEVSQRSCFDSCHDDLVRLPRLGGSYTVSLS